MTKSSFTLGHLILNVFDCKKDFVFFECHEKSKNVCGAKVKRELITSLSKLEVAAILTQKLTSVFQQNCKLGNFYPMQSYFFAGFIRADKNFPLHPADDPPFNPRFIFPAIAIRYNFNRSRWKLCHIVPFSNPGAFQNFLRERDGLLRNGSIFHEKEKNVSGA